MAVALLGASALAASSAGFATATSAALLPGATQQTNAPERKDEAKTDADAERGLTEQERRGKLIYMRGESPSGREFVAMVGELDVPASTMTCAGCHGTRGEGKTTGGVTAGALAWSHMMKSAGHTHPNGRKHGPFDETMFTRAVVDGFDPAGNELADAMPRFKMAAEDVADLIAYLKRIESDR